MAVDIFATRTMLRMLDEAVPATTFLRDRYFSDVVTFPTKTVEIDIRNGRQRIAPFVHPRIGGKMVERGGYKTSIYEPPETSPEMLTTAEDIMNRAAGENPYSQRDPMVRAAEQVGSDLAELDNMVDRLEEWECSQAIFTGKIIVKGEGYDEEVQYWTGTNDPYVALNASQVWSASTGDPLADLKALAKKARTGAGVNATDVLMGSDALDAFLGNEKVQKTLDNRRIDRGQINPQTLPDGVSYYGYVDGLDIYTYDAEYEDEEGNTQVMVPSKLIMVGSPRVRTSMAYGAVAIRDPQQNRLVVVEGRRVPYSYYSEKNPQGQVVQIKAKPLPIVHQIQGFQIAKVLT